MAQAFWTKGVLGAVYNWWRQGRRSVHGAARRGPGVQHVGGQTFVYPIHAVSLMMFHDVHMDHGSKMNNARGETQ